tara:strand:- start:1748 stop:1927 length:180 start_codon:yes stop_codon:yes gene_type:complete
MTDNNTLSAADRQVLVKDLIFTIEQDPAILDIIIGDYVSLCNNKMCQELEVLIGSILGD